MLVSVIHKVHQKLTIMGHVETYALVPTSGLLVRGSRASVIAQLNLVDLGKILFVGRSTTEITLATVV